MKLSEIKSMPTCLDWDVIEEGKRDGCAGFSESLFRSYHILEYVKGLLYQKVSHETIIELIEHLEEK